MNLKQRFLTQSILILVSTIAIACCAAFAYSYFYGLLNNNSITNVSGKKAVIVMENDNIIYNNEDLSSFQVKEILMNISVRDNNYNHGNRKYSIDEEDFTTTDGSKYKMLILTPIVDSGKYYRSLILFFVTTFLLVFILANIIVQRQNIRNIITPISNLTKEMEKLRAGELETAITEHGYGEIINLGGAVEQLRLQLKNSIYYQRRVDENRKFLISSISHDLKTPVTSIRGYLDGILEGVADTEEKKQRYLSKAVDKAKLINTMIEDLLLYSKLDLNQMPFEREEIDIIKYMESCIEDSSVEFKREDKNITFKNELMDRYFVDIDNEKFKRVVQNIVDNAKKNIEIKTGQLEIILRETQSSVIVEFKDNGKGISKDDLPYIFERFYRADTARAVGGSSGLGLAIAKEIVEGLGGRIWAVSQLGEGVSIIISLKKIRQEDVII